MSGIFWAQAQVVNLSDYATSDLPRNLSFSSIDAIKDPEAHVQHVLSDFADSQPSWKLPILSRSELCPDIQLFGTLTQGLLAEERAYVYEFAGTWQCMANNMRVQGTDLTPLDEEVWILLTLMSMSIPMLARAFVSRNSDKRQEILEAIDAVRGGLYCLHRMDDLLRRKPA